MEKETFPRSLSRKRVFISFLGAIFVQFAFNQPILAKKDSFYVEYPNCRVRIANGAQGLRNSYFDVLKEKLKYRNFTLRKMPVNSRIGMEELYLQLEKKMVGRGLIKICQMKLTFFVTKSDYARPSSDKLIFTKTIRRQFPRHSIEGHERCEQAIKDLFVHIPPCGKGRPKRKKRSLDLKKFLLNPKTFSRDQDLVSQRRKSCNLTLPKV